MRKGLLLLLLCSAVQAQKPGDIWRTAQIGQRIDSVAGGRVYYTVVAHEDTTQVGQKSSMVQSDWGFHTILVQAYVAPGNPAQGKLNFIANCARCHTGTGEDLHDFQFPKSDIMRRGLNHCDTQCIVDIIASVNAMTTPDTMAPNKIPFQPGGRVLAGDSAFAVNLWGQDQFSLISRDSMLKINPVKLPIGFALLKWSDENSPYDWLPGANQSNAGEIPTGVALAAQSKLDAYNKNPTATTAMAYVGSVLANASLASIVDAPCLFTAANVARYQPQVCADVGKHNAVFLYTHSLRFGTVAQDAPIFSGQWWEDGHVIHKAQQMSGQGCGTKCDLPMRDEQIAGWIYLGWMWDRALNKNSLYGGGPLNDLGFNRHVSFIIARTMVERPIANTPLICSDIENMATYGSVKHMLNAMTFVYNEMLWRDQNHQWNTTNATFCAESVRRAQNKVGQRAGAAVQTQLAPLAAKVTAALTTPNRSRQR
jgi:hypothetical protein